MLPRLLILENLFDSGTGCSLNQLKAGFFIFMHHTKDKGDLAVAKVTLDLISKQYEVCSPVFSEHYKYDLIAVKNNKMFRIQCKYSKDGLINPKTSWADKNGNYSNYYLDTDFEYYGVYLPSKDVVIYPSISFKGSIIKTEVPNSNIEFYWYLVKYIIF